MLDSIENDTCCRKRLMRALLAGLLCNEQEWTCPQCGCPWVARVIDGAVRQWEPRPVVAIVR